MNRWPRGRQTTTAPSKVRILDAAGNLLREIEPPIGNPPCQMHGSRQCRKCDYTGPGPKKDKAWSSREVRQTS